MCGWLRYLNPKRDSSPTRDLSPTLDLSPTRKRGASRLREAFDAGVPLACASGSDGASGSGGASGSDECSRLRLAHIVSVAVVAVGAMVGVSGCKAEAGAARADRRARAVVTVAMVGDVIRNIAAGEVDVVGLIGEGVDPHLYAPTRDDIVALQQADIVFYSGLMLEGKLQHSLEALARSGKPVHAITAKLDHAALLAPQGAGGHPDPHVWMDPSIWSKTIDLAADALAAFDPSNAERSRANAAKYAAELGQLHDYVKRITATIPPQQRVLITAHDAFSYFGRAYGIEVRGIQGISTESEAGLDDINRLVEFIVQRQVPAVFVETSVAEKNVRALIEGAAARGHSVRIGAALFSDAMGPAGTYEGTYIGMIDHNATLITRALGGDAPERGMQGRLAVGGS